MSSLMRIIALGALGALFLTACQAETSSPVVADRFEVVSGAGQHGAPGTRLDSLIVLRLLDEGGRPMAGVAVQWQVLAGGGSLEPGGTTTSPDGLISTKWSLGLVPEDQRILATTGDGVQLAVDADISSLTVSQMALGWAFGCGIDLDKKTWCWGENWSGTLGVPDSANPYTLTPLQVGGDSLTFTQLSAGDYHVCGLVASGEAYCWGSGYQAQLGNGVTSPSFAYGSATPVRVIGVPALAQLESSPSGTCGLTAAGDLWCWGSVAFDPLRVTPVQVFPGTTFERIALGDGFACGIQTGGRVACWGSNTYGALGRGTTGGTSATLMQISAPITATSIDAGWAGACAITTNRDLYCWGQMASMPGHGYNDPNPGTPTRSSQDSPALRVSLGYVCGAIWQNPTSPRQLCGGWNNDIESLPSITSLQFGGETMCLRSGVGGVYCKTYSDLSRGAPYDFAGTGIPAP